jgi:hypothetical protein
LESTVLESLSCPGCFTHYGLRPERVHPGIRRARCFSCGEVFGVEEAVQHLLSPGLAPHLAQSPALSLAEASPTVTLQGIQPEDLLELDLIPSAPPPPAPATEAQLDAALTLGDLEVTEDEILEKTLIIDISTSSEAAASGDETSGDTGGFASAKDAIAKLLGDVPPPVAPERRNTGRTGSMDVEATLDALEFTLGGTPTKGQGGSAAAARPEPAKQTVASTVRLSPTDLQAAMAAGAPGGTPPSQTPTVAIPSLASTLPAFALPSPAPAAEASLEAPADPNLLKIQVGQETYQNVTIEQITSWIEQGRVQDWHMVARQFSDNWIEAGKVPALRPVFERVRRMAPQTGATLPPEAPAAFDAAPVKKSLFGWMSDRT